MGSASSYSEHEIAEINHRKSLEAMRESHSLPSELPTRPRSMDRLSSEPTHIAKSVSDGAVGDGYDNVRSGHERRQSHLMRRESALDWDMSAMTDLKAEMGQQLSVLAGADGAEDSSDVEKETVEMLKQM